MKHATAKFQRLIQMLEAVVSSESRSRDFIRQLEGEFASCGLDDDERFSNLQNALAMFGATERKFDEQMLASECQYALRILKGAP